MQLGTRSGWGRRMAALVTVLVALGACTLAGGTDGGCLAVSGPRLVAAELGGQDPRFLAIPPDTDLGYLPEPGERRMLTMPTGEPVCIERASRVLGESEILGALEIPGSGVTAAILDYPHAAFPKGTLRFPASGVSPPARGADSVLWRGSMEYEPGRTIALWARIRLQRTGICLRAATAIAKGERLLPGALEAAACDAGAILAEALAQETGAHASAFSERAAARTIRKGEWLTAALLADPAVVVARREAMLELRSGGARLVLPVMPEESGRTGDVVWVRSVATRERLQARVAGADSLTLTLPGRERQRSAENVVPVDARRLEE